MGYEIKSERVELEGGQWADFFLELRHGTQRAVNVLTRPLLSYGNGKTTIAFDVEPSADDRQKAPKVEGVERVEVDLATVNWDEVNDTMIIGQVKAWSFGDVNQSTLDDIPESTRGALVEELNRRYGRPLPTGGGAS